MYTTKQIIYHALQMLDMHKQANNALIEDNTNILDLYLWLIKRRLEKKRHTTVIKFLYEFGVLSTAEAEKLGLYIPTMKEVACPF